VVGPISIVLIVLSIGDLLVTYTLLRRGGGAFEANPIARWFFDRWNMAGMTGFKFGMVAFVVLLGETIERHRPGLGRAILGFGCLGAAAVMIQGLRLLSAG
jgi:hypothetical protein